MKKILISALMGFFLLMALPDAHADYTEGYFSYIIENEIAVITGYFGDEAEVTVPAQLAGYPVCAVAEGAFDGRTKVTSVALPDTAETYAENSFGPGQEIRTQASDSGQKAPKSENESAETAAAAEKTSGGEDTIEAAFPVPPSGAASRTTVQIDREAETHTGEHSLMEDSLLPGMNALQVMGGSAPEQEAEAAEEQNYNMPLIAKICADTVLALFGVSLVIAVCRAAKRNRKRR